MKGLFRLTPQTFPEKVAFVILSNLMQGYRAGVG